MTTPSIPTAAPWRARPVVSWSSDWRDWSPQSIWRDGHSIILNLLDPRGLIPAPVPFAIGRWKAPDYDLSFEMELAINVHKPTILPMMLLVSRTVSTLLQFTCVIPMRTGEIWQGGNTKNYALFSWLPLWRRDLPLPLRITKSCQCSTDSAVLELSLYFPVYVPCLNTIFPLERKIIIQL